MWGSLGEDVVYTRWLNIIQQWENQGPRTPRWSDVVQCWFLYKSLADNQGNSDSLIMMLKLGILFAVAVFLETASAASVSHKMYFSCLQTFFWISLKVSLCRICFKFGCALIIQLWLRDYNICNFVTLSVQIETYCAQFNQCGKKPKHPSFFMAHIFSPFIALISVAWCGANWGRDGWGWNN